MSDERTLLEEAQAAIGGFLWLGNNLHNIKGDPARFRELYEAALADAEPVYERLKVLRARAEDTDR